ncbi:MAG: hypothetical protein BAJATHORv1_70003 [Candidatus Thorarchaeota archaeon]|nr:MAG: hypothetical protein BAJATHORv1_70003 [Candidatus Thorarchaeota archaeon]
MFENDSELFAFLGIDLNSVRMDILSAIIKTQGMTGSTFEDIMEQLLYVRGKKANESLVYRSLSELEDIGFISIDKSEHIHIYSSGFDHLEHVLSQRLPASINELRLEQETIEKKIKMIRNAEGIDLAKHMVEILTGKKTEQQSRFALGLSNIFRLLSAEIFANVGYNDVIRISLGWGSPEVEDHLIADDKLEGLLEFNTNIRILVSMDWKFHEPLISLIYLKRSEGFNIEIRRRTHFHGTYQFLSHNDENLVLITSEKPLSAAFIPEHANRILVADAIRVFDKEFSDASIISEGP